MKKALLSSAAFLALSAPSFAADLPSKKSINTFSPPLWSGFYAGLNAGYGFGTNNSTNSYAYGTPPLAIGPTSNTQTAVPYGQSLTGSIGNPQNGFVGGAQFGYNYLYSSKVLMGLETDISGTAVRNSGSLNGLAALLTGFDNNNVANESKTFGTSVVSSGVDYLGTVRARLGYLLTPTLLAYGTAGFSYGGVYANVWQSSFANNTAVEPTRTTGTQSQQVNGYGQTNQILVGWNAGGGLEWAMSQSWSLKAEAIYWNLGNANVQNNTFSPPSQVSLYTPGMFFTYPVFTYGNTQVNYQGIIARMGLNYHFNSDNYNSLELSDSIFASSSASKSVKAISTTSPIWTGFYAGLNAGYGFGTNTSTSLSSFGTNPGPLVRDSVTDIPSDSTYAAPFGLALSGITGNNQNGFAGGAQFGYNYLLSKSIVIGIETDISGTSIRGGSTKTGVARAFGGPDNVPRTYGGSTTGWSVVNAGVDYLGTLRGRIGYLVTPSLLTYGTGGFSYGGVYGSVGQAATDSTLITRTTTGTSVVGYQSVAGYGGMNQLSTGWNAGAGLEWMFVKDWSLKAEALYWNLGNATVQTLARGPAFNYGERLVRGAYSELPAYASTKTSINYQGVIARAGVNYHFNLASVPVVAKY